MSMTILMTLMRTNLWKKKKFEEETDKAPSDHLFLPLIFPSVAGIQEVKTTPFMDHRFHICAELHNTQLCLVL